MSTFYKINRFDILTKMFQNVIIPEGVFEEFSIKYTPPKGVKPYVLNNTQRSLAERIGLGKGESQAIALAIDLNKFLAMDDFAARKLAKKIGLKLIGTLGLVKIAFEDCLIEEDEKLNIVVSLEKEQWVDQSISKYVLDAKKS